MPKIVHFEITGSDVAATARFYADVFGWPTEPSPFLPDYVLMGTGTPTGAVMSDTYRDQKVIVWHGVDDIEAALKAVIAAGGAKAGEINAIPGQGKIVYAADINGTLFGLKQSD